ncbi:MAG: hypothetical protein IJY25_02580 [Bacilli bacterium]|nr:hypothetical protein [Bacilli bacterium]
MFFTYKGCGNMALTKSQIKAKIDEKERLKKQYQEERDNYAASIDYSGKIIRNLKSCVNSYLSPANDSLEKYFTIDGKSADNGQIPATIKEINSIANHMNNNVVSDLVYYKNYLDNEISNLKTQIDKLWVEYNNAES